VSCTPQLVAACLTSQHPIAVADAAGDVLASSSSFPLRTARLDPADSDSDFLVIDIADVRLWVATAMGESREAIELLATTLRHQGAAVQRHSKALANAANEIDTLSLLAGIERLLGWPDAAAMDAVAERLGPRLKETLVRLSLGVGAERVTGSRPPGPGARALELQRSAVNATADVSGPLDAAGEALLREVLERLVSAGERQALELARLRQAAAEEAAEIASILAHELNSPAAALTWALSGALETLAKGDVEATRETLEWTQAAAKRLARVGSELRLIGTAGYRYRRIAIQELLGWFDRHRATTTACRPQMVAIIGDPLVVRPALEDLGAGFADAEASFEGVAGEVAVVRLTRASMVTLSPALRDCGITLTAAGDALDLAIPFRLIAM
jgi:hypothetical protein